MPELRQNFVVSEFKNYYLIIRARKADMAKATARIMVALKMNFSKPLRVWNPELKLSPRAPPNPAAVRCNKMPTERSTAKMT